MSWYHIHATAGAGHMGTWEKYEWLPGEWSEDGLNEVARDAEPDWARDYGNSVIRIKKVEIVPDDVRKEMIEAQVRRVEGAATMLKILRGCTCGDAVGTFSRHEDNPGGHAASCPVWGPPDPMERLWRAFSAAVNEIRMAAEAGESEGLLDDEEATGSRQLATDLEEAFATVVSEVERLRTRDREWQEQTGESDPRG